MLFTARKWHKRFLWPCVVILQWDAHAVLNKEEQKKTREILDAFHFHSFFRVEHTPCQNESDNSIWNQPNIYKRSMKSLKRCSTYRWMDGWIRWDEMSAFAPQAQIFSWLFCCWFRGLFPNFWVLYSRSRRAGPSRQPTHTRMCALKSISVSPLPALDESACVCLKREMCQSTSR